MKCGTCKHFKAIRAADGEPWRGTCELHLPSWLHYAIGVPRFECATTVRTDDSCSFHTPESSS